MSYNLFLDDMRFPEDAFYYTYNPIYNTYEWEIVRTYDEFVKIIEEKGIPKKLSFDHDLGGEFEIWKDVIGYEDIYIVSNLGRVARIKKSKGTAGNNMLKQDKNESGLYVMLRNKGNDKKVLVHRLVGEAFVFNHENKTEINHKDGNRWNNRTVNLEWVTSSENALHAHHKLKREYTAYGENHSNSKTVSQYNKNNKLINIYGSVNEAGRQLNIEFSNIAKCARGKRKTAGGFVWRYENKKPTVKTKINFISKKEKNYSDRFFIPSTFSEKTGYDCAKWLVDYCIDNKLTLPKHVYVHSMNPVGKKNIQMLFTNFNNWSGA